MKTFDEILESGVLDIYSLENQRLEQKMIEEEKLRKTAYWCFGGGGLVIFIFAFIFPPVSIFAGIVSIIAYFMIISSVKAVYMETAKQHIVSPLIHSINESFVYHPNSGIDRDLFSSSTLVSSFNRYHGEDYFAGNVDGLQLEFSQLLVQYKTSGKNSSTRTVFHGLFFVGTFPAGFAGRLVVVPDTMEKALGGLGRIFQNMAFKRDALLKIDNPRFEQQFAVYSNNNVEAMQYLSDDLCNYLLDLMAQTHGKVYFGYQGDKFFLALYNRFDIFRIDIKQIIDEALLRKYYNELVTHVEIMLNINNLLNGQVSDDSNIIEDESPRIF
jgi:hypothetical protein